MMCILVKCLMINPIQAKLNNSAYKMLFYVNYFVKILMKNGSLALKKQFGAANCDGGLFRLSIFILHLVVNMGANPKD